jgi:hypothetical protein
MHMQTIAYLLVGLAIFVILFLVAKRLFFATTTETFEEEEEDEGAASEIDEASDDGEAAASDDGEDVSDDEDVSSEEEMADGEGMSDSEASEAMGGEIQIEAPSMADDAAGAIPQIIAPMPPPPTPASSPRAFDDLNIDNEFKWSWQYAADDVDEEKLRKTKWQKPYIDTKDIRPFDLGFGTMGEGDTKEKGGILKDGMESGVMGGGGMESGLLETGSDMGGDGADMGMGSDAE